jgi:hypothetical protein
MSGPRQETTTQSSFPNLRILPVNMLLPHEEHDAQRAAPLIARLEKATHWLNPPIASPITNANQYVILDGANRHYSLSSLGYRHILVQVVDYDSPVVSLETWHHAVRGLTIAQFLPEIHNVDGITTEETSLLNARAALAARHVLGYVVLRDERVFVLHQLDYSVTRTSMLRRVVNAYKAHGQINRITHDEIRDVRANYPDVIGIVVFPRYEPAEIMVAARDKDLLPPGITRHIIYGRALRLNYPLEMLKYDNMSLEDKNRELESWVQTRLTAKAIRFYAEPTFVFDE